MDVRPFFDPLYERQRLSFITERDGSLQALTYARDMKRLYLRAALDRKQQHGKRDHYRALYIEAAYSFRFLASKL